MTLRNFFSSTAGQGFQNTKWPAPQRFLQKIYRERLSEKMCTRQSRKVIWDMIDTLFLTALGVEPTFVAFL